MENQQKNKISLIIGILVLVLIIVFIWPRQPNNANSGRLTIALGQEAIFKDLLIKAVSIAEDSRCKTGVQCIQAGTVRIVTESHIANGAALQNTIKLGETATIDKFTITFDSATPYPQAGKDILKSNYRFTFDVR